MIDRGAKGSKIRLMSNLKRRSDMGTNKACDIWFELFKLCGRVELDDHKTLEGIAPAALTNRFDALFTLQSSCSHHRVPKGNTAFIHIINKEYLTGRKV